MMVMTTYDRGPKLRTGIRRRFCREHHDNQKAIDNINLIDLLLYAPSHDGSVKEQSHCPLQEILLFHDLSS